MREIGATVQGRSSEEPRRTLKVRQRRAIGFGTIANTVLTMYWGPGRFSRALRAVRQGRLSHLRRGCYVPPDA